jgi:hypothetical protein
MVANGTPPDCRADAMALLRLVFMGAAAWTKGLGTVLVGSSPAVKALQAASRSAAAADELRTRMHNLELFTFVQPLGQFTADSAVGLGVVNGALVVLCVEGGVEVDGAFVTPSFKKAQTNG